MIVGAAVLIPLLLGTILIARYVDIRSATVQASRYAAFERATNLRSMTDAEIERKVRTRLFTVSDSPLRANDGLADNAQWRDENPNFQDFSARPRRLIARPADVRTVTRETEPTSAVARAASAIVKGIDTAGSLTGSNFDLNTRAFHTGTVSVRLANLTSLPAPLNALNLTFTERTAVLGDAWQAGGPGAVAERSGALVPTRLFTQVSGILEPLLDALSLFEPALDDLCLGQVNPEIVPNDRLGPQRQRRAREFQGVMLTRLTLMLIVTAPAAYAQRAPELPPRAIAASIGDEMIVNGVAMRATHFQSPAAPRDVLAFYRESWKSADPSERASERTLGSWQLIGRQTLSRHETVQIRPLPGGGSEGYIASSDTRSRPRAPARSPLSLPLGAKTVSVVESKDGSQRSTQILASAPFGVSMTSRWLRTAARIQGFEPEFASDEPTRSNGSQALFLKRGAEELIAVVQPAGKGSVIVLHHVSAP